MIKPNKRLGQHFLKDINIARKIVSLIDDSGTIIEIGPGKGILSRLISERFNNVYFVEVDKNCVNYLIFNNIIPQDKILNADFIKLNLYNFSPPIVLIGNIPYNITSKILFKVLYNIDLIQCCVFMVQLEVAERMVANPDNKNYGILSVLFQRYFNIEKKLVVAPSCFYPQPKVFSSVIKLIKKQNINRDFEAFKNIVKTAFNQRRKILLNSLSSLFTRNTLPEKYHKLRAENLTIDDYIFLANLYIKNEKRSQ